MLSLLYLAIPSARGPFPSQREGGAPHWELDRGLEPFPPSAPHLPRRPAIFLNSPCENDQKAEGNGNEKDHLPNAKHPGTPRKRREYARRGAHPASCRHRGGGDVRRPTRRRAPCATKRHPKQCGHYRPAFSH